MSKKDSILAQLFGMAYDKVKAIPEESTDATIPGQRLVVAVTLLNNGVTPEDAARATGLLNQDETCPEQFQSPKADPEKHLGRK